MKGVNIFSYRIKRLPFWCKIVSGLLLENQPILLRTWRDAQTHRKVEALSRVPRGSKGELKKNQSWTQICKSTGGCPKDSPLVFRATLYSPEPSGAVGVSDVGHPGREWTGVWRCQRVGVWSGTSVVRCRLWRVRDVRDLVPSRRVTYIPWSGTPNVNWNNGETLSDGKTHESIKN